MEGSSNQTIRMSLYTGGLWKSQRTRHLKYDGHNIHEHVLEVPSNLTSFSVLKDLVTTAAGLSNVENFKFTYKCRTNVGITSSSIRNDMHLQTFMRKARMQSKPIGLYLECEIMEGSSNDTIRMLLFTGGKWQSLNSRHFKYDGHNIHEHVLEVPSNLTSFSVLKDLVTTAAGLSNVENFKFTYRCRPNVGIRATSIRNDMHLQTFMHSPRMQSKPIGLYLDCELMEGSPNEMIRMLLYTGGSWQSLHTWNAKYEGRFLQEHVLEVPSNLTSFSALKDLVRNAANLANVENCKFAYKCRTSDGIRASSIRNDMHLQTFMHKARMQSKPIGLYLE